MTKMTSVSFACLLGLVAALPAQARYGSNFGMMGYPSPTCMKPFMKPTLPFSRDQYAITSYNQSVDVYNMQLKSYYHCINTYIDNANYDAQSIVYEVRKIGGGYTSRPYGSSNLGFMGYPSADKVCGYSYDEEQKHQCLSEYIENARKDIEKIKTAVRFL